MNEDSDQPPVEDAYHPESVDNPLDYIPDGFKPMHVLEENQRRHGETFGAGDESNAHTLHEQMAKLLYSHGGDMNEIEEDTIYIGSITERLCTRESNREQQMVYSKSQTHTPRQDRSKRRN